MEMDAEEARKRPFVEWCADSGRIRQMDLAEQSGLSQQSISRVIRGVAVASQSRYAALLALNAIRESRGLSPVSHDEVTWTW